MRSCMAPNVGRGIPAGVLPISDREARIGPGPSLFPRRLRRCALPGESATARRRRARPRPAGPSRWNGRSRRSAEIRQQRPRRGGRPCPRFRDGVPPTDRVERGLLSNRSGIRAPRALPDEPEPPPAPEPPSPAWPEPVPSPALPVPEYEPAASCGPSFCAGFASMAGAGASASAASWCRICTGGASCFASFFGEGFFFGTCGKTSAGRSAAGGGGASGCSTGAASASGRSSAA